VDNDFFGNDNDKSEKSVFEGAPNFWEIRHGFKDLAMSYMPAAREETVRGIAQASSAILCREDHETDAMYGHGYA